MLTFTSLSVSRSVGVARGGGGGRSSSSQLNMGGLAITPLYAGPGVPAAGRQAGHERPEPPSSWCGWVGGLWRQGGWCFRWMAGFRGLEDAVVRV